MTHASVALHIQKHCGGAGFGDLTSKHISAIVNTEPVWSRFGDMVLEKHPDRSLADVKVKPHTLAKLVSGDAAAQETVYPLVVRRACGIIAGQRAADRAVLEAARAVVDTLARHFVATHLGARDTDVNSKSDGYQHALGHLNASGERLLRVRALGQRHLHACM